MYIPDLGPHCYLDTASFDWLGDWSARVSSLDHEALACQKAFATPRTLQPFSLESMTAGSEPAAPPVLHVPLYQRGIFFDSIKSHAPELCELVEAAPLVRIPNYAPEASIITVQPGGSTVRHHGRTNAFCMIMVVFRGGAPLQVMVGGERRHLHAGESLAFDPSFEFEFSSAGDSEARALAVEVWNPGVSRLERDAMAALSTTAVNFDTRLQELA
jgi:aspartate beta-hydroxylase